MNPWCFDTSEGPFIDQFCGELRHTESNDCFAKSTPGSWHPKISRTSTETYIQIETQVCIITYIYIYYMQYVYIHIHYQKLHWQKTVAPENYRNSHPYCTKKKQDESRDQIRSARVFYVTQVLRCRMLKVGGEAGLKVLVWRPGDLVSSKMFRCALNYTCFIMVGWIKM